MENDPSAANAPLPPADVSALRDTLRSSPAYSALRENLVEMLQGGDEVRIKLGLFAKFTLTFLAMYLSLTPPIAYS